MADNGGTFGGYARDRDEQRITRIIQQNAAAQTILIEQVDKWRSHGGWMDAILREYLDLLATLGL